MVLPAKHTLPKLPEICCVSCGLSHGTWASLVSLCVCEFFLLKGHWVDWIRANPNSLIFNLISFVKTLSPNRAYQVAQMVKICVQCRRPGFYPWVGKNPWRRAWQPTPVFFPGKSHGQRSLVGYISPNIVTSRDTGDWNFSAWVLGARNAAYNPVSSWGCCLLMVFS